MLDVFSLRHPCSPLGAARQRPTSLPWAASRLAPFNPLAGTNYLSLGARPKSASLMNAFKAWPWYLLVLEGLVTLNVGGMYLPLARLRKA